MIKNAKVICGFPGVGKTHLKINSRLNILDSDSSKFDKEKFPDNYISHIKANLNKVDLIMVSTHREVIDALIKEKIFFSIVAPNVNLKKQYILRYKNRGSDFDFISLISNNWENWIEGLKQHRNCGYYELQENQYLSDIIK